MGEGHVGAQVQSWEGQLSGDLTCTAQTQTLQGHSLLAGGTMGLGPGWGGRVWITGGQGALWFSRNKILLRGSATRGLESWTLSRLCLRGLETPSCSCASTCREAGLSGRAEGACRRAL